MVGITTASMIGLGGAALGAGASIFGSLQGSARSAQAAQIAQEQQQQQMQLQAIMLQQQREFQTATQTDANGNKLVYSPTQGWVPLLSPKGLSDQAAARAAQETENVKYFGRDQTAANQAFQRKQGEGDAARQLIDQIRFNYGAPTREGVTGTNTLASVTGASEPADAIRGGATAAALRTGFGAMPLGQSLASLDRTAAGGIRSAIAQTRAQSDPLYNQILADWRNNKISPMQKLNADASTPEGAPMPQPTSGALDAQVAARAAHPLSSNPYAGLGTNQATKTLMDSITGAPTTPYGSAIGDITANLKGMFPSNQALQVNGYTWNPSTTPWDQAAANPGAYNNWQF